MNRSIPSFELYGEFLASRTSDAVHHETIKERSSQHDWTIRLHRHRHLAQIFLFRTPGVLFRLGDIEQRSSDRMILVIPPGVPHGFQFSEDVIGDVVSVRLGDLPDQVRASFAPFQPETDPVFPAGETANFEKVETLVDQVSDVFHGVTRDRGALLHLTLQLITTYLASSLRDRIAHLDRAAMFRVGRHDQHAERFCTLLEDNFRNGWSVNDYARQVGLSAPQLTRVCRQVLGAPPNDLVRQRRLLEAKRLLEYTRLSMADIAERSGFRDPAYFSRSFKAATGRPPMDYRQQLERD